MARMHAQATVPSTLIRDRFLADHQRLDELFARLLGAFEADDRELVASSWTEFESGLLAHIEAEEEFLIPALARSSERDARSILQEHGHIRERLAELGAGVDLHIVRLDAARAFIDELRAHAGHEDALMYRWGDQHLGASERQSLISALVEGARTRLERIRAHTP
jgi:hemerythrin-like domain-containing protein